MTVNQTSTVVGVFRDRAQADQAMDALNSAGFDRSQIHFAGPGTRGNFLEDIKSLFVGQSATGNNIAGNLTDMGLSDEEAQYYTNEYNNGNTVVAVKAPEREQEALNVLHSYNAYAYRDNPAYAQEPVYAGQSGYVTTDQGTRVPESQAQYQANEQQRYANVPINDQPTVITNASDQQPYATTNTDRPSVETQRDVATNEHETEFQNLQAQIQAVQQQLQEARLQLQSAKEREAQIRSVKEEHEKRLRDSKQQLQDMQSELQNTLAELRDTQSHIGQYQ